MQNVEKLRQKNTFIKNQAIGGQATHTHTWSTIKVMTPILLKRYKRNNGVTIWKKIWSYKLFYAQSVCINAWLYVCFHSIRNKADMG